MQVTMRPIQYFVGNMMLFAMYLVVYLAVPFEGVHFSLKTLLALVAAAFFYATVEACFNDKKRAGPVLPPMRRRGLGFLAGATLGIALCVIGGQPSVTLVFSALFFGAIGGVWGELRQVM
jgi:hypothetical protein